MATKEMDQFAELKDAEAVRDAINMKHGLEDRRAYELANMSPDIRPEHYDQCLTQTFVGIVADSDGTFLVDVHPAETETKPEGATRVVLTSQVDGSVVKTVAVDQPPTAEAELVGDR